ETITTEPSMSFMTYGFVDYEGDTEYNCPRLPVRLMIFAGVCMGICVCGLVGNGIIMWFLGFHRKQNPFTVYILNLAVADFSLLLIFFLLLSLILILIAFCLYNLVSFYLDFVVIVEFLCHFFDLSSLGLLAAISVERCISVL
ncbi:MRGRH protein, partial [Eurystomus gularis]|nr:MRGRH protein [Eurystomus gularis]